MNVRDKKRWPAPCPPLPLSLYGALAVPIVEAQGRVACGHRARCLQVQDRVSVFSKIKRFAGVFGDSFSVKRN